MKKDKKTNFTKLTKRRGISLIVLIVTIIVIIILAAAVILTLSKNNPIESSREARFKEDVRTMQDDLSMYLSSKYTKSLGNFDPVSVNLSGTSMSDELSSTKGYEDIIKVVEGKLVYIGKNENEKIWFENLAVGIVDSEVITNYTSEEIETSEYLFAIGKTKAEYVVAKFNEDYTEVVITKNGEDSDGLIQDFAPWSSSPMSNKKETLQTATIKKGVTNIGYGFAGGGAFIYCSNLTNVTIADSVTYIGQSAFSDCTSLKSITIPNSVTEIDGNVFYRCTSLTNITFPSSVVRIGQNTLSECTSLKEVKLSNSLTNISFGLFQNCSNLGTIIIPDSVISIDESAFKNCTNLTNITIPDSVINIGEETFLNTPWYDNQPEGVVYAGKVAYIYKGECSKEIILANDTKGIADEAFQSCYNLENIIIPNNIKSICSSSFAYCVNLKSVTIPDSVDEIGWMAFFGCSKLTSIMLPDSVTSIDDHAFRSIASGSTIYCETQTVADLLVDGLNYESANTTVVVDPSKF